jgi:hypothetical protein
MSLTGNLRTQAMSDLGNYVLTDSSNTVVSACLACGKFDSVDLPHKLCAYCPTATYCSMCVFVCGGGVWGAPGGGEHYPLHVFGSCLDVLFLWSHVLQSHSALPLRRPWHGQFCTLPFMNGPAHPLQRVPEGGLEGRAQGNLPQAQGVGRRPAWREHACGTYIITNMRNN